MIICHDAQLADVPLEQVPAADLTCNEPNFELEEDRYGPLVNWNGSNADEPPFSTYTLYYSKVMNIDTGKKMANEVKLNGQSIRTRLTNLEPDSVYRVCLYNSYLFNKEFIPGQYCKSYQSPPKDSTFLNDIQEISPIALNYEAFVGVLGGMFFTSVASLIVLLIRRTKKQRPKFMFASCDNDNGYNNVAYHSKLSQPDSSKADTNNSADASKEFDVTMIRIGESYAVNPGLIPIGHLTSSASSNTILNSVTSREHLEPKPNLTVKVTKNDNLGVYV